VHALLAAGLGGAHAFVPARACAFVPRVAVRIAYHGPAFAGSQRQPDQRTVEGELLRALARIGALAAADQGRFQCASRTDRGVSAVGNVVAFDTAFRLEALLPALGAATQDVWPHGWAPVPPDFEARRARRRSYVYLLEADVDRRALDEALQRFVGTHDFRNFGRLEPSVDPVRSVHAIRVDERDGAWAIRVEGESFLWNQVRRMVEAARRVAAGEAELADIDRGLKGERVDLGTAPPEPLVLLDVDHGLAWQGHPNAREAALAELGARLAATRREARVLTLLRDSVT
jgi:tRNA pseudouridine38-40 synthase